MEKWLEGYVKATSKLSQEVSTIENLVHGFLANGTPPSQLSEAVIDHDYTLLAAKRYCEGAKEYWHSTLGGLKKLDLNIIDPIRGFLQTELRAFKVFGALSSSFPR